jgi:hypothetical protein
MNHTITDASVFGEACICQLTSGTKINSKNININILIKIKKTKTNIYIKKHPEAKQKKKQLILNFLQAPQVSFLN